jgi:AcrR family transcriptional regulator
MQADVKTRRAEYAEQTRGALLDAAGRAFAAGGYASTSLAEVASAARVTKGAVYHHFSDKRALFEAVVVGYYEAGVQRVYDAVGNYPDDAWGAALAAVDAALDECMDPVVARLIYVEGPVGLGWSRWREAEERYTRQNVRLLLRGLIDSGIFSPELPAEAMTQLVTGMITHAGMALADASSRQRRAVRRELGAAFLHVMVGLRSGSAPA